MMAQKLKPGHLIRYKSDKVEGYVVEATEHMVVVHLNNGDTGHLHPLDACKCLERYSSGKWKPLP